MPSLIPCGCAVDARDLEPATECTEHAALRAERDALRALLAEAADDIEGWGAYASEYFQKKHDLEGNVKKFRDAALREGGK